MSYWKGPAQLMNMHLVVLTVPVESLARRTRSGHPRSRKLGYRIACMYSRESLEKPAQPCAGVKKWGKCHHPDLLTQPERIRFRPSTVPVSSSATIPTGSITPSQRHTDEALQGSTPPGTAGQLQQRRRAHDRLQ